MKQSQASHRGRKPCSKFPAIRVSNRRYVMPRQIIQCPIAPSRGRQRNDVVQEEYTIHLITPLFGGGVEAGQNDPITPIRPSGIRGQLRFWWRATRGARLGSIAKLRQKEGEIWGTTEKPSQVSILMPLVRASKPIPCAKRPSRSNRTDWQPPFDINRPLRYVLFPFQGKPRQGQSAGVDPSDCIHEAELRISLRYPAELKQDVHASLWAWVNFGGLGSRTRRGCGAVYCDELSPANKTDVGQWYKQQLQSFDLTTVDQPGDWPTLPSRLLLSSREARALDAWSDSVMLLQRFRQGPGIGRNPGSGNRPGRSYWPEPESIREISDEQHGRTSRPLNRKDKQHHMPTSYFPRAEFGMPIIFEIRREDLKPTLQPSADISRMASPLILKPLAVSADRAVPMIMRLNTKPVDHAVLQGADLKEPYIVESTAIRNRKVASYSNSPLRRSPAASAIEGFMAFARQNGFREVG